MHLTPHPFLSSDLQQNPSSLTQATDNIPQHGQRSLLVKKTAGVKTLRTLTNVTAESNSVVIHPRSFIEVHVCAKILACAF